MWFYYFMTARPHGSYDMPLIAKAWKGNVDDSPLAELGIGIINYGQFNAKDHTISAAAIEDMPVSEAYRHLDVLISLTNNIQESSWMYEARDGVPTEYYTATQWEKLPEYSRAVYREWGLILSLKMTVIDQDFDTEWFLKKIIKPMCLMSPHKEDREYGLRWMAILKEELDLDTPTPDTVSSPEF